MNKWADITQISLPLPFALKIIQAYVVEGNDGITLIDTGLHNREDIETWERARKEMGWNWQDVEKIVLTHYHPDHYGSAGTLQEWTGAPVYVSQTDAEQAMLFWREDSDQPETMAAFYVKHGLEEEWAKQIPDHLRSFRKWVEPHPQPTYIAGGETIRLGNRIYQVLHTPGHADGHLSFYDPEREWLIGGDFLLPKISPNISLWPGCDPNPLRTYLATLDRLTDLPVKKVFPSHGPVFEHYRVRIEELKAHHNARLKEMLDFVVKDSPKTAKEVCDFVFGSNLSIHNLRFALSETLAHLEYLRSEGTLKMVEENGRFYYTHS